MKKKIVHIIDDLGRGGAETMLIDLLPDLAQQYDLTLVTLRPRLEFNKSQVVCARYITLNYDGFKNLRKTVKELRKIIEEVQPDLVRAQLYWSSILTRFACPKNIPLVFSVHATMNEDPIAFYKKYFLYLLEKATYRSSQTMIGVTQAVVDSFEKVHPKHGQTYLLHNFVRNQFFTATNLPEYKSEESLRLVTVSNIRLIKNIPYMVEALNLLKGRNVMLDIYGDGPMKEEVQQLIAKYDLPNITLKGKITAVQDVLPYYHAYISSSTVEGFGIAVAEAMSVGLPVIVSGIPVYREICGDHALYIDNTDPRSLEKIIAAILDGQILLKPLSKKNKEYAVQRFSKAGYLNKLSHIYQITLARS